MGSPSSVLLLGASGLVGGECLRLLANDPHFQRVVLLTRSPGMPVSSPKIAHHRIDFDDPVSFAPYVKVDCVICALGTTIRKAGSQPAFRKVDYEYPVLFAKAALEAGARHFLLVSSVGANPSSGNFYLRVKGETEAAITSLGYPAVTIFRPSLLLGKRQEFRFGEQIAKALVAPLGFLLPPAGRPVQAAAVAAAIVAAARTSSEGVHIVTNAEILRS